MAELFYTCTRYQCPVLGWTLQEKVSRFFSRPPVYLDPPNPHMEAIKKKMEVENGNGLRMRLIEQG